MSARNVEELKKAVKNLSSKEVEGETIDEVLRNYNRRCAPVVLTISVKDSAGEAIASPTLTLKKGATVGSGDAVSANANGTYNVSYGSYNVSASKTGYTTKTDVITVGYDEADAGEMSVTETLEAEE